MSDPHLPEELLDHIADLLYDERDALKSCCLVSKSWNPRSRKHLFANVEFLRTENLKSWKTIFPDPSTSPAHYTKSLSVKHPVIATPSDAEEGGWIRAFSHVVQFSIDIDGTDDYEYLILIPFHGFSPVIKSLLISFSNFPSSRIFNLVRSFPLLEDLSVITTNFFPIRDRGLNAQPAETPSSSPPVLTGCLKLSMGCGMDEIASRLLLQLNALCFRKLDLSWIFAREDVSWTRELVARCCLTLESLSIRDLLVGGMFVFRSHLHR
jgi:hypothetical protein